jgi:type I restriction-modification system DNA methylase subunit
MDASQYKDYVLSILFIKYVSDKYAGHPYGAIKVPPGASFADMMALKGRTDIGDQINKKIIAPLATANKLSGFPDFDDSGKLGSGKQKQDTLTNLIAVFEDPALNFGRNRAEGDDILGDAYEYLRFLNARRTLTMCMCSIASPGKATSANSWTEKLRPSSSSKAAINLRCTMPGPRLMRNP